MTQPSKAADVILEEALSWQVALERVDADWDSYLFWLEADPRHRDAFNSLALVERVVGEHRDRGTPTTQAAPALAWSGRTSRWWPQLGLAMAAALALVFLVPLLWTPTGVRTIESQGSARVVVLGDGVEATLSPQSELRIHGDGGRRLDVARGEVYFDVRHDPARSMTVAAGRYTITDIGTRFSVNLAGRAFRLGVADGKVDVATGRTGQPVQVRAGQQLLSRDDDLMLTDVTASDVASWRMGRLAYNNAPLPLVVADISRYTGRTINLDPSLEHAHFSGSLVIGDGTTLLGDVASILGARVLRGSRSDRLDAAAR